LLFVNEQMIFVNELFKNELRYLAVAGKYPHNFEILDSAFYALKTRTF